MRQVVRTWVYVPDGQVGWLPYAVRAGQSALETRAIDAIYSTSFPVTAHLAARRLKQISGRPWVADFRDLWTENPYAEHSSAFRRRVDQVIESDLLDEADALVTVSETLGETLRRMTRERKRIEIISNGFDSTDFADIRGARLDKWTVTYVGTFYGAKQDPSAFLAALSRLIDSGKIDKGAAEFKVVGEPDPYVGSLVSRFGLDDITRFTGFVPYRESLRHQMNSSLLLLILHREKAVPGVITGKLYEYLASRRPILAIVPPHFEAAEIVRKTRSGSVVEATEAEAIERELLDSYSRFRSGEPCCQGDADLSAYERRTGAERLANLLGELTGKGGTHVGQGHPATAVP